MFKLRQAVINKRIEWRKHTLLRLVERQISQKDIVSILLTGEVIRDYVDDRPFPSVLVFGWIASRPIHVVASYDDAEDKAYIITVYEPSLDVFEPDFKTRRS
ncbi:DUF4258 domain-containing protein [Spirosoma panaciterrae]|uniref:DUF4258 domain-containing protein n=1 Tax=Spirosoma panaciterrae TaxID=496058 RepID=UPI001FE1A3F2|nr:DUF4258 domain-containing protein [Spirosoma panaciterrae]